MGVYVCLCVWCAGEDVSISMEVYKLVHVAGRPLHTWLYSRTNEPVKVLSRCHPNLPYPYPVATVAVT